MGTLRYPSTFQLAYFVAARAPKAWIVVFFAGPGGTVLQAFRVEVQSKGSEKGLKGLRAGI